MLPWGADMKPFFVPLVLFLNWGLWGSPGLADVLDTAPAHKVVALPKSKVVALLTLAARQDWNVFDLLNEAALYLKARDSRIVIGGDDLREAAKGFSMGGSRVDVLLPLNLVVSIAAGAKLDTVNDVEIRISKPFSAFLELGDFDLQTVYGFSDVENRELGSAFGVTVRNGIFRWRLQKVDRVSDPTGGNSPHFIAIHLDNFFRPKRWKIEPISFLKPPTKR